MKRLLPLLLLAAAFGAALFVMLRGQPDAGAPPAAPEGGAAADLAPGADRPAGPEGAARASAPASAPAAGEILVLDHGEPAPDALIYTGTPPFSSFKELRRLGRTGADGRLVRSEFAESVGSHVFAVRPWRVAPPVPWTEAGVRLDLGDGVVMTGRVLDPEGAPIPGAVVSAVRAESSVSSDREGRYRLPGLRPIGPERIFAGVIDGGRGADFEIEFTAWDQVMERDIVLDAPPPGGILVEIRHEEPPEETTEFQFEANGKRMTLEAPPGGATLRLPRFPPGAEVRLRAASPGFTPIERVVAAPPEGERLVVVLTLRPGASPLLGRVVNADGAPAGPCKVYIGPDSDPQDHVRGRTVTTAADGTFRIRLDWRDQHFLAMKPGEAASDWVRWTADEELVLRLGPGSVVAGRVLDQSTGAPVAGVPVELRQNGSRTGSDWRTLSDESGAYRFAGVPVGVLVEPEVIPSGRATGMRNRFRADGGRKSRTELVEEGLGALFEEPGQEFRRDLMVVLRAGGAIVLRAELPPEVAADPVHWTHAQTGPEGQETRVGTLKPANGIVEVETYFLEGRHEVEFRAGRYRGHTGPIEVTGDGDLGVRIIEMQAGPRVVARLVDSGGAPVRRAGVVIRIHDGVGHPSSDLPRVSGHGTTDADGFADVSHAMPSAEDLKDRKGWVAVTLAGDGLFQATGTAERANLLLSDRDLMDRLARAEEELRLDVLVVASIPLTIQIVDLEGNPVAGAHLRFSDAFAVREGVTGPDGRITVGARFEAEALPRQAVEVLPPHLGVWSVRKGDQVEIRVGRLRSVRVVVVDEAGAPVAGAEVASVAGDPGATPGRTDERGSVDVVLPEEGGGLRIRAPGFWSGDPVWVPAATTEFRARLHRPHSVRVRVVAPEALAFETELLIEVVLNDDAGPQHSLRSARRTGPDSFETEFRLPAIRRVFEVVSPDKRWEAMAEVAGDAKEVVLVLEPRKLYDVELILLGEDDKPLADTDVRLHGMGPFLPREARTDGEGRIRLKLPRADAEEVILEPAGVFSTDVEFPVPAPAPIEVRIARR